MDLYSTSAVDLLVRNVPHYGFFPFVLIRDSFEKCHTS